MFGKPKTAKRLFFDVIPKAMDDHDAHLRGFQTQEPAARLENPAWHIHRGQPPVSDMEASYSMLLNLASAANAATGRCRRQARTGSGSVRQAPVSTQARVSSIRAA